MKKTLITLAFLFFTCYFGFSQSILGVYNTDFNELTITQNGNSVTGTYKYRSGRIEGTLNGRTLTGFWYQDNGKGKLIFEFNSDFSGYTGKWGYNDAAPASKWNGTRIGGGQAIITNDTGKINGVFNTDFNELTITQNGNSVTGTYKYRGGRIEGTLSGRTLTGFWYQDNGKGKLIFEFNSDFSGYTGKWGYNDAAPASKWNGTRIGVSQTSTQTQQSTGQIAQASAPKISDSPTGTSVKLNVDLTNTDAVAGDLKQNSIQLNVSKGTFDQQIKLQVKENGSAPQFDKKRANLIGTPFEITIDQKTKRLFKPVIVKLKLDKDEIVSLKNSGDLWMSYYNGKKWDYFIPLEVNLSEAYVKFETYHFSLFAKAEPTKEERINDFSYKNAVNKWAGNDNNTATKQAIEQMVSKILSEKMGLDNKSLTQDIVEAMLKEDDYTNLMVSYNDGRMEDFAQDIAIMAGSKICDIVTNDSNAKGLLGMVTDHSSKVGTGIKIAVALSEGDGETAAKELSLEIINSFPLTSTLKTAAEITEQQINRWKDQELEAAYQVFVKGAESSIPWWGYQVEPGKFDEVWSQMRGLETKILDDAIKNYAALKNMRPGDLNTVVLEKIRKNTRENLRQEFIKRKDQEAKIEAIQAENIKLVKEFENANLLVGGRFGYTDNTSFDFRLERLFRVKDMILKDTKSRLGFTGVDAGGIISAKTVATLLQIWYSDNGKEKYQKELTKLGYSNSKKLSVVADGSPEGLWAGADEYEYPKAAGLKVGNPMLFVVYNVGQISSPSYRLISIWYDDQEKNDIVIDVVSMPDNMLAGFRGNQLSYSYKDTDLYGKPTTNWVSASRLSPTLQTPVYPESISVERMKAASTAMHSSFGSQPEGQTNKNIGEDVDNRRNMIKGLQNAGPAFQRAAEKWLKERKFNISGAYPESYVNADLRDFELIFKKLLNEPPVKK